MKCIDCKYHSVLDGKHWCDFDKKKPKRIRTNDAIKDVKQICSIDYESEIKNLNDKYLEEVSYLKEKINELQLQLSILESKWSVVEMIFRK